MKEVMAIILGGILYMSVLALYVLNIVQLFQNHYETTMLVFKILGALIPPLGIVMAFFG